MNTIIVQGIGFVGMFFLVISYQAKSNKMLFILQMLGCLAFSLQFALLGAYSGCIATLINIVRNLMLTKYNDCAAIRWKGWIVVFSLASAAAAMLTWNGWVSILPVIAIISATYAFWTNNAGRIRIIVLFVNAPCMLLYNLMVHSWAGVLNETITIVSIIVSIIRFGWKALDGDTIEKR